MSVDCPAALEPEGPSLLDFTDPQSGVEAVPGEASAGAGDSGLLAAFGTAPAEGLISVLRRRFGQLPAAGEPVYHLVIQEGADHGLLPDEHRVLQQIVDEAAAQARREGSLEIRILLRRSRLGPAELSVAGEGSAFLADEVAASYRSLAALRQLAQGIGARLNVRRLQSGGLFIRCATPWV